MVDEKIDALLTTYTHHFGLTERRLYQFGYTGFGPYVGDKGCLRYGLRLQYSDAWDTARPSICNFLYGGITFSLHSQDRSWHTLFVQPFVEFEIIGKQLRGDWREVYAVINSTFEGERAFAVAKRDHTNWHPVFEQHFAIGARLRIGYNLLIALSSFGDVCQPN